MGDDLRVERRRLEDDLRFTLERDDRLLREVDRLATRVSKRGDYSIAVDTICMLQSAT